MKPVLLYTALYDDSRYLRRHRNTRRHAFRLVFCWSLCILAILVTPDIRRQSRFILRVYHFIVLQDFSRFLLRASRCVAFQGLTLRFVWQ